MDDRVFKRIHFFRGFIPTTRDYREAVGYHLRKGRLHNRYFHGMGVVQGVAGELQVSAPSRSDMSVVIRPGVAIDPLGQVVLVRELEVKEVLKEDLVLPRTMYLVLRFVEAQAEYRHIRIPGFPEREGFARVEEAYTIDWTIAEPDNKRELELCRLKLTEETDVITDARDRFDPQPGEIDLRWVKYAGVCSGSIAGVSLDELRAALLGSIRAHTYMARTRNLPSALSVSTSCVGLAVLTEAQQLNGSSLLRSLSLLGGLQRDMIRESDLNEPALSHRKNFREYREKVERSGELLEAKEEMDAEERVEAAQLCLGLQVAGMKMLHGLVQPPAPLNSSSMDEMEEGTGIRILDGTDWERLKVESRMPAMSVLVEGREWRLIDDLNILDPDSERDHSFEIGEAIDWWRSQVQLKYPDGAVVGDEGIGHKGGYAQWEVHNVVPGQPLVVIRRMDYARGDYWCRIWVNDVEAGEVPCNGEDVRYRWRNWPFYIHPHFVRHRVIRIKQGIETANRDVNFFRLWFYQPV